MPPKRTVQAVGVPGAGARPSNSSPARAVFDAAMQPENRAVLRAVGIFVVRLSPSLHFALARDRIWRDVLVDWMRLITELADFSCLAYDRPALRCCMRDSASS